MVRSNFLINRFDFLVRFVSRQNERKERNRQQSYKLNTRFRIEPACLQTSIKKLRS